MLVFLRSRGCRVWVASALAAAYMMNTEFVSWSYHQWALASFCWMPWVLWALYAGREKSPRYIALAAVFLGLSLLGATLQHVAFILIVLGCVWMGWMTEGSSVGAPRQLPWGRPSGWGVRLADSVLLVTTGLLNRPLLHTSRIFGLAISARASATHSDGLSLCGWQWLGH